MALLSMPGEMGATVSILKLVENEELRILRRTATRYEYDLRGGVYVMSSTVVDHAVRGIGLVLVTAGI
jgi:hypothetical protein